MRPRFVMALVGLSGVGKSTLLAHASLILPIVSLQASALIKDEVERRSLAAIPHDALREASIEDNQSLLVSSFHRNAPNRGLVVIDGHTIVDTPTGIVNIETHVFRALEVRHFAVLIAKPEVIISRRAKDAHRNRPQRSIEEVRSQQDISLMAAIQMGKVLDVPVTTFRSEQIDEFISLCATELKKFT